MKKHKIILSLVLITFFLGSCGNTYELQLTSPKSLKINEKLTVSVSEKENRPIDSVRYYLDGKRLSGNKDIDISDNKLGKHAISATVFYPEGQKKLTNTIVFFAEKSPEIYTYEIVNEYPHDENAFTQGLEYHNGFLYESTGQTGESTLRKVELKTGKVVQKIDIDKNLFGEGMTIFNNKIYMLTWQGGKGFVFNLETFEKEKEFHYAQSKEGWGLTHNSEKLIKSDGTDKIWFLNPETGVEESYIEAYTVDRAVPKLNELEFIDGKIYANVWQRNSVVMINPETGALEGIADLKGLQDKVGQKGDDKVLNGIAYDAENDRLFVTGKDWNTLFEIKLNKKQ
ncbi:glutaminyl-peptide cyclotransferase [Aureibaculum sp. 2210JD6-5]|uniref:glutaminyl-peptide cyclotransferase n=1 Tax=Aureibaculum sp. 2210JD6-5 TaxID=3103957 RepID=UPI002AAE278C|nr:glutaminyl-peptide cyclotransferase [Aureibaculum sp. 2210JD6-5]MDY7395389.1 glutaminyl-peptide cyclotransferase [Aureibaculum sp. 2210JD6-5]